MQIHQFGKITQGDHLGYLCHITQAANEMWYLTVFKDVQSQSSPVISELLPDLEAVNAYVRTHDWAIEWPDSSDAPQAN